MFSFMYKWNMSLVIIKLTISFSRTNISIGGIKYLKFRLKVFFGTKLHSSIKPLHSFRSVPFIDLKETGRKN